MAVERQQPLFVQRYRHGAELFLRGANRGGHWHGWFAAALRQTLSEELTHQSEI
jgi:hypothetical protein